MAAEITRSRPHICNIPEGAMQVLLDLIYEEELFL